jgi:hypothetical protein
MNKTYNHISITFGMAILLVILYSKAALAIELSKKRIILTPEHPRDTLTIVNNNDKEMEFFLEWTFYEMQENGRLKKHTSKPDIQGTQWADTIIEFNHSTIKLAPNESTSVKLNLKEQATINASGEFRAHLWIYTEPNRPHPRRKNMSLSFLTGVVIPVFAKYEGTPARLKFDNTSAIHNDQGGLDIRFDLLRSGDYSSFGNIDISCKTEKGRHKIKTKYGYAIYTEVAKREFSFKLKNYNDTCSALILEHTQTTDEGRKTDAIAEVKIDKK